MKELLTLRNSFRLLLFNLAALVWITQIVPASAQPQTGKRYSLTCRQESLPSVLKRIERMSGYKMLFTNEDLCSYKITVEAKDKTIDQLMGLVIGNHPLSYKVDGEFITVSSKPDKKPTISKYTVEGKVLDSEKQPLIGATIRVSGSNDGTITDVDGGFQLEVPDDGRSSLEVSFVGMQTQKVPVKNRTHLVVVMEEDSYQLSDLIVTGYQTLSKERATGSFEIVDKKVLDSRINTSPLSAIEGQITGVSTYKDNIVIRGTSTFSDNVGTTPLLVIDGIPTERSLSSLNVNDIESIVVLKDAAASSIYGVRAANGVISVVTTKSSEGKTDVRFTADWRWIEKPSLEQYHYASTSDIIDFEQAYIQFTANRLRYSEADYLRTYLRGVGEAGTSSSRIAYYSPFRYARTQYTNGEMSESEYNTLVNQWKQTDYRQEYMDRVWRTPLRQSYNFSVNTGSGRQSTYVSLNYIGSALRNKYENSRNLKGYIKTNQKFNNWLSADFGIDIQYSRSTEVDDQYNSFTTLEPYTQIIGEDGQRLYRDYVDIDRGSFTGSLAINPKVLQQIEGLPQFMSYRFNILDELEDNQTITDYYNVRSYLKLNIKLMKGLKFTSSFSYELNKSHYETFNSKDSYYIRFLRNRFATNAPVNSVIPEGGRLATKDTSGNNWVSRNQLDYNATFNEHHAISLLGGIELRQKRVNLPGYSLYYGYDPVSLNYTLLNNKDIRDIGLKQSYIYNNNTGEPGAVIDGSYIKLADSYMEPTLSATENRYLGIYAVGGYTYGDRYGISGSFRIDQANLFGTDPKYRYRPLWSVGLKWNMAKENFMKRINWINVLDLRFSYGLTGNVDQTTTPYLVAKMDSHNSYTAETIPYTYISTAPNPLLRWERTATYNVGADFILLGGKLNGKFDYYYKRSDDLLTTIEVPFTSGYASQRVNYGAMTNQGIELSLSSSWLHTKDWSLQSSVLFSYNRNKVTKAYYKAKQAANLVSGSYYEEGRPVNSVYAYRYGGLTNDGTDEQNGIPIILRADGTTLHHFSETGALTIDGSTTLMPEDAIYMGSGTPIYEGSFTQSVKFRNWDLSAMVTYSGGHYVYIPTFNFYNQKPNELPDWYAKSWSPQNPDSQIPKHYIFYPSVSSYGVLSLQDKYQKSEANVKRGDIIRLRNVTLSYTLPISYTRKIKMQQIRISAQASNPFYWCAAGKGIDSETLGNLGYWTLPTLPSYLLKIDVQF